MAALDPLWELIHSLNFAEKQRFKSRSYQWTRGHYNQNVDLFDAIGRQKQYDEAKLKGKYKDHAIGKRFRQKKN